MSLSVSIMAHPARSDLAAELSAMLDAMIVWDQDNSEWNTGAAAWRAHRGDATHHLVLQDDAQPCQDLVAGVEQALQRVPPGDVMSLYFGYSEPHAGRTGSFALTRRAVAQAQRTNASWLVAPGTWWGVALVMPVEAIGEMLDWCDGRREPYDMRIGYWCQHTGRDVWYPWPSLVEHADGPSLVRPGRPSGRRAWSFVGENASAMRFDPAGPVVTLGRNKRPRSIGAAAVLRSVRHEHQTSQREPVMARKLHDPLWRRPQLHQYLRRRRERYPSAASEPAPPIDTAPQRAPEPEPAGGEPVSDQPPPESGRGSGADAWRQYLVGQCGFSPADVAGMTRNQMIAAYHDPQRRSQ